LGGGGAMNPESEEMAADTAKTDSSDAAPVGSGNPDAIREQVIEELKTVFDPEIPVNIYELGLIYQVTVAADGATQVTMTLTCVRPQKNFPPRSKPRPAAFPA
jgi:hypothetical protein